MTDSNDIDRLLPSISALWSLGPISPVDCPKSPFSLFTPILAVLLLLSAPSYSLPAATAPSDSIITLFDFSVKTQTTLPNKWFHHERCPNRLKHFFQQGLLKPESEHQGQSSALDDNQVVVLIIALRMREAIVKAWPLIGFPKVISPLGALTTHFQERYPSLGPLLLKIESRPLQLAPSHVISNNDPAQSSVSNKGLDRTSASTSNIDPSRGLSLFKSTYSTHSSRVLESLNHSHPSLPLSALNLIYQPLLSDDSILDPHPFSTSLICLVTCLATGLQPQAQGHFGGAKNCVKKNLEKRGLCSEAQGLDLEGVEMDLIILAIKTTALLIEELKFGPRFSHWKWLPEEVLAYTSQLQGSRNNP